MAHGITSQGGFGHVANPTAPDALAPLAHSFETSRYQEQFLATAFEAVLPIIRRRIVQVDSQCEHIRASELREAMPVARGS